MQRMRLKMLLAVAGALAFAAGPVLADVQASHVADGVTVTVDTEGATIHFDYVEQGCDSGIPCLEVDATMGVGPLPVSASGCAAKPGVILCPAAGIKSITFIFKKSGGWSAYHGGGGQHASGPCSPAAVNVEAGANGGVGTINAWNGCPETVVCKSGGMVAVEGDAIDAISGPCLNVVRH
ncbi:MAG TPA: hypothetical protein VKU90_06510 [Caulobacteraceae bacterium]|nr:hypothetical protein [Caulobacteraceae bacterium]